MIPQKSFINFIQRKTRPNTEANQITKTRKTTKKQTKETPTFPSSKSIILNHFPVLRIGVSRHPKANGPFSLCFITDEREAFAQKRNDHPMDTSFIVRISRMGNLIIGIIPSVDASFQSLIKFKQPGF